MMRSLSLGLCALLLVSGCGLLKKKDNDKEGDTTSGTSGDRDKGTTSGNDPQTTDDDPPPDKAYKGCKMPKGDIRADWTITKGCKTKLKNAFYVQDGVTLTIEAGVKVECDTDTWIWIEYGKLVIAGTEKEPVIFTSSNKSPAPGDWVGLGFREKTAAGTSIDHMQMEYAGSKASNGVGAIHLEGMRQAGRISITNSKITKSAQFGIVTEDNGGFAKFENNTLADNKSGSLNVQAETLNSIGGGNKFGGDIHVKDSHVDESGRWPVVDVPYQIDGNLNIGNESKATTVTLPEKGLIKLAQGIYIEVAHDGPGALVAKNVTFSSASPSPSEGDWGTIFLYPKSNGTDIEGSTFEFFGNPAGSGKGGITFWSVNAKDLSGVTIKDNTFRKGKVAAMTSDDGLCAPFDKSNNKADGVPLCGKP
jgi:hypothetical protein